MIDEKTLEGGRDVLVRNCKLIHTTVILRSSGATHLPKQGQLEQVVQDCVHLSISTDGKLHNLCPCTTSLAITESQNGRGWKGPLWVI